MATTVACAHSCSVRLILLLPSTTQVRRHSPPCHERRRRCVGATRGWRGSLGCVLVRRLCCAHAQRADRFVRERSGALMVARLIFFFFFFFFFFFSDHLALQLALHRETTMSPTMERMKNCKRSALTVRCCPQSRDPLCLISSHCIFSSSFLVCSSQSLCRSSRAIKRSRSP